MPSENGYQKIVDALNEMFLIVDPGVIKLLCASVIANRLPRDPVWLLLVTPSSGGKTEFITALSKVRGYTPISELTPNTFISGQRKMEKETSLLLRLKRNDILIFKDFTTMLQMQRDTRAALMSQFREIYDGSFTKRFGTGAEITWLGKLGFIGAVTTAIYTSKQSYAAMGERFILYSFNQPDRELFTERAMDNADTDMGIRREHVQNLFHEYLDEQIIIPTQLPKMPAKLRTEIIQLANLTTIARSAIQRDYMSAKKEIEYVHALEMPGRFATQLSQLVQALMIMNDGKLLEEDKHIIYKICLDSIDQNRRLILQTLTHYSNASTASMATHLHYPTETIHRWLEDVTALELVDRKKDGRADMWILKPKWREILSRFEGIPMLASELVDPESIADLDNYIASEEQVKTAAPLPPETQQSLINIMGVDPQELK